MIAARVCKQCGNDLSSRYATAIYCFSCMETRSKTRKSPLKRQVNLKRLKIDGEFHCVDCRVVIPKAPGRGGVAMRCPECAIAREKYLSSLGSQPKSMVNKAVANGEMLPANAYKCVECGRDAEVYDHRNYSRPLDVEPVCRACNVSRGHAADVDQKS